MNLFDTLVTKALVGEGGGSAPSGQAQTLIPEQTFTASESVGNFYSGNLTGETLSGDVMGFADITVTYDGTDYYFAEQEYEIGAPITAGIGQPPVADFSNYPFSIGNSPNGWMIAVADTEQHTVKVNGIVLRQMYIDENGEYNVVDYVSAYVDVPTGVQPSGTKYITQNSDAIDVYNYAVANVNVPVGVFPSGTYNITSNGTYTITNYENVNVNVQQGLTWDGSITIVNSLSDVGFDLSYWTSTGRATTYIGYGQQRTFTVPTYYKSSDYPKSIEWWFDLFASKAGTFTVTYPADNVYQPNVKRLCFNVSSFASSVTVTIS